MSFFRPLIAFYAWVVRNAACIVFSAILLLMRIVFGYNLFLAGKGKLLHIEVPIAYFQKLGIPAPTANAWLVGCTETVGGLLLLAGFGSRAAAFAVSINMTVAILTTEHDALAKLFNDADPTAIFATAPFWFLVTALLVLARGPGLFSLDAIGKLLFKRAGGEPPAHAAFPIVYEPPKL